MKIDAINARENQYGMLAEAYGKIGYNVEETQYNFPAGGKAYSNSTGSSYFENSWNSVKPSLNFNDETSDTPDPGTSYSTWAKSRATETEKQLRLGGWKILNNLKNYYKEVAVARYFQEDRATPLPIILSLTTYGISSIICGDIFKVNYLPRVHRDNVYFQTMKIRHTIDSTGWFTSLDTQFRVRPLAKNQASLNSGVVDACLSIFYITNTLKLNSYKVLIMN